MFLAGAQLEQGQGVSMREHGVPRKCEDVQVGGIYRCVEGHCGGEFGSTWGEVEYMLVTGPAPSCSAPLVPSRTE